MHRFQMNAPEFCPGFLQHPVLSAEGLPGRRQGWRAQGTVNSRGVGRPEAAPSYLALECDYGESRKQCDTPSLFRMCLLTRRSDLSLQLRQSTSVQTTPPTTPTRQILSLT